MGIADGLKDRLAVAMAQLNGSAQTVSLRRVTETGADTLLGIRGKETVVDTVITPTPFVTNVSYQEIQASQGILENGDMALNVHAGLTKATVEASLVVIGSTVFRVVKVDEMAVEGKVVWLRVLVRRKHTVGQT